MGLLGLKPANDLSNPKKVEGSSAEHSVDNENKVSGTESSSSNFATDIKGKKQVVGYPCAVKEKRVCKGADCQKAGKETAIKN
nr:unnamed protein product [Callosobruchus analis]